MESVLGAGMKMSREALTDSLQTGVRSVQAVAEVGS